tara:strand:+ start:3955 stop:5166 length:1212 start_codon:yes stop_codon:yes gene_type:complete
MPVGGQTNLHDDYESGMEEVKFYGWGGDPQGAPSFATPMHWVRIQSNTAEASAHWAIRFLESKVYRDRVLHLWHPMTGVLDREQMVSMLLDGYNIEPLRTKYFEFYDLIKQAGLEPYRVVCDFEGGLTLWNWEEEPKQKMLQELYKIPECVAQLPPELQGFTPADYELSSPNRNYAHHVWGGWSNQLRAEAMRQTLYEPQQYAFGEDSKCTNYADSWKDFPIDNWNDTTSDVDFGVSINESAPVMYLLNNGGPSHRFARLTNATGIHWRWICFLDKLNHIRSNVNKGGCAPWISPCGYQILHNKWNRDTPWLDAQFAGHAILSGVYDFHYWNPGPPSQFPDDSLRESTDAYSSIIHEVEHYRKPYTPMWEKIEVNEDSIPLQVETHGFVTTYEDYMRFKSPNV